MASKPKDISGNRYGRLIAKHRTKKSPNGDYLWLCICDCGGKVETSIGRLNFGAVRSCGCLAEESRVKHGMAETPTYRSWKKMLSRVKGDCGGEWYEDVTVCDRWNPARGGSFANFFEDMGERPDGKTLNRVQGAKIYSKETCEWASLSLQSFDQKKSTRNRSGRIGVRWRQERGVWQASITKEGKIINLYYGPSFEEACEAREKAELELYGITKTNR